MKSTTKKKITVELGKSPERDFDTAEEAAEFIAEHPMRVTNIRRYGQLTTEAIEIFKKGLHLCKSWKP